jgi:sucrose phosphorylase
VEAIHRNSGGSSRKATGTAASNLDLYQVNCTYYDALGRNNLAYLLARAVQFFLPGIPQVYYVGLLAGCNDLALLEQTGVGRDINRQRYSAAELLRALQSPVVRALIELMKMRNSHPAFGGTPSVAGAGDSRLTLRWDKGAEFAELDVDFATLQHTLRYSHAAQVQCRQLLDDG